RSTSRRLITSSPGSTIKAPVGCVSMNSATLTLPGGNWSARSAKVGVARIQGAIAPTRITPVTIMPEAGIDASAGKTAGLSGLTSGSDMLPPFILERCLVFAQSHPPGNIAQHETDADAPQSHPQKLCRQGDAD